MNAKRLITLLLVAALAVGVCPAVFAEGDAPRGILLFAGYTGRADGEKYPAYSRDDIARLTRNASDLVICAGGAIYNTYAFGNEDTPIVTQELIDTLSPELVGSADLESVRRDYRAVLTGVRQTPSLSSEPSSGRSRTRRSGCRSPTCTSPRSPGSTKRRLPCM